MSAFRAGVALEDILIILDHMHYDQIFASAEAYILVLERLDSEVRTSSSRSGLCSPP